MRSRYLPILLCASVIGCETIREEQPTDPTPATVAPAPIPIVIVPVPIPTPGPQGPSAPAPTNPGPTTPNTPAPPPPSGGSCNLGPGGGSGTNCLRESPSFLSQVESGMDQLVQQEPQLFDLGKTSGCSNCYLVLNPSRYVQRMVDMMVQRGLCAHYDGEELAVKSTNSFNDQYDILTSSSYIRRQSGSYRATCRPAWF